MNVKKAIKYLFIGITVSLIGKLIIPEIFDNQPFKFEKYQSDEQLEGAAKLRFPLGSKIDQIRSDLEKSGAWCDTCESDHEKSNEISVECIYLTNLFSLHPLERYEIWLDGDKDYKLIKLGTKRVSGLELIIP